MSNVKSESQVIPRFLIEDLTNVARGARVSITLDTNLSGLQTRMLGAFQLLMESKHLCESCCLERFWGLKHNLVANHRQEKWKRMCI